MAEIRRIVVTGASAGIGHATAQRFVADGHRVAVVDRAPATLPRSEICRDWSVDVSQAEAVRVSFGEIAEWLGGTVDAVFHMAGIMGAQQVALPDVDDETWGRVLTTNLTGTFVVARAAHTYLAKHGGLLVLTSSQGGVLQASGSIPYGASKAGIHGMILTLEEQLRLVGIRVVELVPGRVDTPLYRESVRLAVERTGDEAMGERLLTDLTTPEEVSEIAAFLITPAGSRLRSPVATR